MPMRVLTVDGHIDDGAEVRKWFATHMQPGRLPPPELPAFWLDIQEPDLPAIDWLADEFNFHPLTIEDLHSPNERGKLETYDGYLFLIAHSVYVEGPRPAPAPGGKGGWQHAGHDRSRALTAPRSTALAVRSTLMPALTEICDVEAHEIHAYLGDHFLITVHDGGMHCVDRIWTYVIDHRGEPEKHPVAHGPDYLLYRILDSTVDTYFSTLQVTDDQIDELESAVIDRPARSLLEDVFTVKHNLVKIRRLAVPMREALNALTNSDNPFIQPANAIYLRDVHNLLVAAGELVDSQRDASSGVLDAYLSSVNNNLSVVMKRMTIIATIFMPISFIVGFGGMNFTSFIPYDSPVVFWGFMVALVVVPVLMYLWFRRNQWT